MKNRVNTQVANLHLSGIRTFSEEASKVDGVISLTIGEPEFATDDSIKQAAIEALNDNFTHYPPASGILPLRRSIIAFEKKLHGLDYAENEIIVTNGSTQGLSATFLALLNPGDEVIIPAPMYVSYAPMLEYCEAVLVELDTTANEFQINEDKLRSLITNKTKMIVITSPNNPTGCVYNQASIDAVIRASKEFDLFVVSDDVYNQLVYMDHLPSVCDDLSMKDRLIITQSLSKPYSMTGWRVGYVLGDRPIIEEITKMHQYMVAGISSFSQRAAIKALDVDVQPMVDNYRRRRDKCYAVLQEVGLTCVEPQGAFYLFPDIAEFGMDSVTFCRKALYEYKVAFVPGIYFSEVADHFFRISYAAKEENLYEGMNRLKQMILDLRAEKK